MTKGWRNEPTRHSLAARGVKTSLERDYERGCSSVPDLVRELRDIFINRKHKVYDVVPQRVYQSRLEKVETPEDINSGMCYSFALALHEVVPDSKIIHNSEFAAKTIGGMMGEHVWVQIGDKHYDAEHPEGVNDWRNLTFWRRLVDDGYISEDILDLAEIDGSEIIFEFMDGPVEWGRFHKLIENYPKLKEARNKANTKNDDIFKYSNEGDE